MDHQKKTTINLNGQRYNALSGQLITNKKATNIDGFVKKTEKINYSIKPTIRPKPDAPIKNRPITIATRKPNPSKTLMRTSVNKPPKTTSLIKKINSPVAEIQKPIAIKTPTMIGNVDPKVARRAKSIKLSNSISRFGGTISPADYKIEAPKHRPSLTATNQKISTHQAQSDPFANAIENATSHQQPALTKKELRKLHGKNPKRGRLISYLAVGTMAVAVLGFAVYKNIPNFMVKVASARAGFAANMPSYQPSGFSLNAVGYRPGMVAFNFKSNVGNRSFSLTEHSSNWDNTTLVSNILVPTTGHNYKKVMIAGQEVYFYGKDQAAWVNSGIWYQVKGNGSISTNQIIKLATNL